MDSIEDWYSQYDLPGGEPSRAPNYYYSDDDEHVEHQWGTVGGYDQEYRVDPFECTGCGHLNPESLDEKGRCPYCRPPRSS
ncbi:hypothetical protein [Streptomyces sp. NPDC059016]|uniref:hypothetical protein n=1 Tax=Streptomyces sp. NPDC059016 TaxID=3346699 RepID=UPI00367E69C3